MAYFDAYKLNGLKSNSQSFAQGTPKTKIIDACKLAEDAILSSTIKFNGRYVYEVRNKNFVIYQKIYGLDNLL